MPDDVQLPDKFELDGNGNPMTRADLLEAVGWRVAMVRDHYTLDGLHNQLLTMIEGLLLAMHAQEQNGK